MALRHPKYGLPCKKILDDIVDGELKAHCSQLVPIEMLGSLSRIDKSIAYSAVLAFYKFPVTMIPLSERIIREASALTPETGVGCDATHAAAMRSRGLKTVITEDVDHWRILGAEIVRPLEY